MEITDKSDPELEGIAEFVKMRDNDPMDIRGKIFDNICGSSPPEDQELPPMPEKPPEYQGPEDMSEEEKARWEDAYLKHTNPTAWRRKQWRNKERQRTARTPTARIHKTRRTHTVSEKQLMPQILGIIWILFSMLFTVIILSHFSR